MRATCGISSVTCVTSPRLVKNTPSETHGERHGDDDEVSRCMGAVGAAPEEFVGAEGSAGHGEVPGQRHALGAAGRQAVRRPRHRQQPPPHLARFNKHVLVV